MSSKPSFPKLFSIIRIPSKSTSIYQVRHVIVLKYLSIPLRKQEFFLCPPPQKFKSTVHPLWLWVVFILGHCCDNILIWKFQKKKYKKSLSFRFHEADYFLTSSICRMYHNAKYCIKLFISCRIQRCWGIKPK